MMESAQSEAGARRPAESAQPPLASPSSEIGPPTSDIRPPSADIAIEVEGLTKSFDGRVVVRGANAGVHGARLAADAAGVEVGEAIWIPGSVLRTAPE